MITVTEYSGQAVGVFGLGKAGEATIASLLAGGARVFAWDDRLVDSHESLVFSQKFSNDPRLMTKDFSEWPWAEIKALILSPGVPLTHPEPHPVVVMAKQHDCPILGDVELLYRAQPKAKFIGITGTNGKSTTTTLIGHILKFAGIKTEVGGNLGTAALALNPLGEGGVYVIETSSYQLDLLATARFNVAVLLNITPDHLDRHGDMQGYIAAKMHIFDRQTQEDFAVVAVDDEYTQKVSGDRCQVSGGALCVKVSAHHQLSGGIYVKNGVLNDETTLPPVTCDLTPIATLTGRHNWQNAAAAYAATRAVGVAPDVIYAAMKIFGGLRHRLQQVAEISGVRFINDSKATNADATQNALAPYDTIYWILGGKAKAGGIETLEAFFPKIAHAFLIGAATEDFAKTLQGKVLYSKCGTLEIATQKAAEMAFAEKKKGAVVLLSPACASFDQFKSFEHRGDVFCALVEQISTSGERKNAV